MSMHMPRILQPHSPLPAPFAGFSPKMKREKEMYDKRSQFRALNEEENHENNYPPYYCELDFQRNMHSVEKVLQLFLVVRTGSIWSVETFLPPLLRSLSVPCTFKRLIKRTINYTKGHIHNNSDNRTQAEAIHR